MKNVGLPITLGFLFLTSAAVAARDDIQQPVDPCKFVRCGPSLVEARQLKLPKPSPNWSSFSLAKHNVSLQQLVERMFNPPALSESDRIRANACNQAVIKYRPEANGPVRSEYRAEFLRQCFHQPREVGEDLRTDIEGLVVGLDIPGTYGCTAVVLGRRTLLTARHCLADGVLGRIVVDLAEVRVFRSGLRSAPLFKGVRVKDDPLEPGSKLSDKLTARIGNVGRAQDFVTLEPLSQYRFEAVTFQSLETSSELDVAPTDRLVVASFLSTQDAIVSSAGDLRIDDFPWCMVHQIESKVGRLRHSCQTIPGSSGAPVFRLVDGKIGSLIALHVGPPGQVGPTTYQIDNEAILLPEEVRALQDL